MERGKNRPKAWLNENKMVSSPFNNAFAMCPLSLWVRGKESSPTPTMSEKDYRLHLLPHTLTPIQHTWPLHSPFLSAWNFLYICLHTVYLLISSLLIMHAHAFFLSKSHYFFFCFLDLADQLHKLYGLINYTGWLTCTKIKLYIYQFF